MSVAFHFHSGEERRVFNANVAKRHLAAIRLAKQDLAVSRLNTGVPSPVGQLPGPELVYRDARLYPIGGGTREIMNELIAKSEGY